LPNANTARDEKLTPWYLQGIFETGGCAFDNNYSNKVRLKANEKD